MDRVPATRPRDPLSLHDHVALDEIELYAEVLIAVADARRPLSRAEIDRVLGVRCALHPRRHRGSASGS
ncbi:hypothetical protein [Nocardiopsis sp. CNT312]|uniref:hypothetical protein n=1 Tax=Nocardiopsis sp. CNT312 TaxID=1137268 RepID=UPI0004B62C20|nr:hypothetical protein [Nocardiopsis sp. CNT312]